MNHVRARRLLASGFAIAVCCGLFGLGVAAGASGVPYVDANAVGTIGLCDQHDQPLTQGDVDTRPFVWKAVAETPAPAPYNGPGATATLYAYQPRKGVDPGE